MMQDSVFRVASRDVSALWNQVEPLVSAALKDIPTHDAEDVRHAILSGRAELFIQFRAGTVEAVVVTEFCSYPKGMWINFWIVSAADPHVPIDVEAFHAVMETLRRNNRCRGFQYCGGRHGWLKRFGNLKLEGISARWTID